MIQQLLLSCLASLFLMLPAQAVSPHWLTLVSLTFDDGYLQSAARNILASHGMNGTFYVNSNLIGAGGGRLTKAELDGLQADGNEIGGHTINHVNLATMTDADQRTAICADMQNLENWYPNAIHSFAYPFSSIGPTTQGIVSAGCPGLGTYESARSVGGLGTQSACFGCPWSETIPPGNPYYLSSIPSVISTTTLADLQSFVTQAEDNGGGWVPLVFHRVCDGCDVLAVSPSTLDTFLTWLEAREFRSTYVRTVHQVMSGDYPAPPPPPTIGANQLINPSLELDADRNNQADCWQRSSYGSNTAIWTHVNNPLGAHSGNFAEQLQITSYSSGDRKLVPTLDAGQISGGCAPTVVAGGLYQLNAWYKADVSATLVMYFRDALGVWRYWRDGPLMPASVTWSPMIYYPGVPPAGTQAISFGISLTSVGTLVTDDYSLALVLDSPPTPDTTPPTIGNIKPVAGAMVSGNTSLSAVATDNVAVQQVEFAINGTVVGIDTTNPYAITWNAAALPSVVVTYTATAVDFAGNRTSSTGIPFTIDNLPPSVAFSSPPTPLAGSVISGLISTGTVATDNNAIARVDFLLNGSVVGSASAAPYLATVNTFLAADGPASLTAMAFDIAGNSTLTLPLAVTVNNQSNNLLTNPSLEIDANNDGTADCWQNAGFGTNTFAWSRVTGDVHSGNFAESLQITSQTTGDRKLVQRQDSGPCAPVVSVGARYLLSAWYKSTVPTGIVVYFRTSAGVWQYWQTSPNVAASVGWAQISYITPPIPVGVSALSFGLYLNSVGTLITDDYALGLAP